ncbi:MULTISPECIES: XrtA/PEP-CTERM system-associated ATPase [unclassified Agarivorans]|uniref:XrtA/PEP-CTERM system-associated ATPase n=1 Tax=unclassified Agarivorans TaxID=2636026 RepID=UPI0026E1D222|nr:MULTISPECIES: XrtA/PEP-CTERM system-associated ATPase [unclassified Agarivorans]MDO6687725.1 XrtA-associated ATPase [Agarivorans sp. 3_MG-2023]MDO6717274.1 XrtA-associated ATPase [Agarivorans sp. 2_MG-2023]
MYESFFGLSDKPFKLSPDPKFFFASPHHDRAVSYLRYGLSQGEGFIVVTGPIGTGKTTIARSLLASIDDSIVAAQIATTKLNPDELVRLVAAQFNIDVEGLNKADILKRFEQYLLTLNKQGKRALLVVDEAQNLPAETVEELRMLSNFQLNDKPLFQSFLLGQEELKPIIELPEMEQFRQRIIASCHLQPLDAEQTQGYILHRLKQVGWNENPKLDDDIFQQIADFTKGIPRKINIFADRLFLYAFLEDLHTISHADVASVIEEMGGELSGSLQGTPEQQGVSDIDEVLGRQYESAMDGQNLARGAVLSDNQIKANLLDVSSYLEEVVLRKIKIIRYLDKMIEKKRKEIVELSENN